MSLLFHESPLLGILSASAIVATVTLNAGKYAIGLSVLVMFFLIYFYRYNSFEGTADDHTVISPCEGTVINITEKHGYYYIAIFLSPFNRHTQIYPVTGTVIKRQYDHTGEFEIVMDITKSKNNEKKIHYIKMNNGSIIKLTQLAGLLPRMITSDEGLGNYYAGEYLGMIKFGSRVDLLLPKVAPNGDVFKLDLEEDQCVSIGDYIGHYVPTNTYLQHNASGKIDLIRK